ncbi:peptidoglycan-binding domain-containing protein [Polaribacter ponticola]|uniref:Peptidoglycan-binding domain-containing protein n=1 Tax=Polaribacter ponticola TaxID=2978475 RepID=A0ABT5S8B4_9FLAO|nr:peptidoglycan-binding domain-containing protein [Polaribacter sp. MSW5]MDD7914349.1 peptidoglycan-binding domain-containing protein [Polaribacter sp. MSW5]
MKQIIIFLLLIIVLLIGYGKYNQYKRYNTSEVNYKTDRKIDLEYHNKTLLLNYYEAIERVNNFTKLQWTANNIDVRTPENDDIETVSAIEKYSTKIGKVKYYEAILENSLNLKKQGFTNKEIQFLEEKGIDLKTFNKKKKFEQIKNLYDPKINLYKGEKNAIIFEVQKRLNELDYSIKVDGVYRIETLKAIKDFEQKNNLLVDGFIDALTLELMFN